MKESCVYTNIDPLAQVRTEQLGDTVGSGQTGVEGRRERLVFPKKILAFVSWFVSLDHKGEQVCVCVCVFVWLVDRRAKDKQT